MSFHQPFLFERRVLPKVWGGRALQRVVGIDLPPGHDVGETWELYDRPEGSSRLRGETRTLADLLRADAGALLGRGAPGVAEARFPLLLKFIDAREALSVQVHPDDVQARAAADGGKSEAWVVLHAGAGARVSRGLRPGVRPEEFRAVAHTPAVERMLWSFTPQVGDCIDVPAGTVHAIGPEVVVFEVQQNSDVTYRLYDWGRPREVHVEQALAVTRFDDATPGGVPRPVCVPRALADGGHLLLATPHFRVRRYAVSAGARRVLRTEGRFATLTMIGGSGVLDWQEAGVARRMPIAHGDTALLPAALAEATFEGAVDSEMLVCDPGVQ